MAILGCRWTTWEHRSAIEANAGAWDRWAYVAFGDPPSCDRLRLVRRQQYLPHVPRLDCDADQFLVSVEYLGKLLDRTAKAKLLDAIDRHRLASDDVGPLVRSIDSPERRIRSTTHRHLRRALDRHPRTIVQIHHEPVVRLVTDFPAFDSEAAAGLVRSQP